MCGLLGAFRSNDGFMPSNLDKFLVQGLYLSALRGMNGTGVGMVDKEFAVDMTKSHVDAATFVFSDKMDWVIKGSSNARAILGHTRSPTGQTSISSKNAHPFWFGNKPNESVMGIHNGHISNYMGLTKTFIHPVDSAHAIYSIMENGALPTLKKIQGAYVLIWYDEKAKTFNIARNDARELYLAQSPDKKVMYYASEKEILRFILDRCTIPYADKGTDAAFMELDLYKLYSWDLTKGGELLATTTKYSDVKKVKATTYSGNSGVYSPVLKPKDKFFAVVSAMKPFTPYVVNKGPKQGQDSPYGSIKAWRRMDNGDVEIKGVRKSEWEEKWSKLGDLPVICIDAKIKETPTAAGTTFKDPVYTAILDREAAEKDYKRYKEEAAYQEKLRKQREEQQRQWDENRKKNTSDNAVVTLLQGPKGKMIPEHDWKAMAKEGCVICKGIILQLDVGKVGFHEWNRSPEDRSSKDVEYGIICPTCMKNEELVEQSLGSKAIH